MNSKSFRVPDKRPGPARLIPPVIPDRYKIFAAILRLSEALYPQDLANRPTNGKIPHFSPVLTKAENDSLSTIPVSPGYVLCQRLRRRRCLSQDFFRMLWNGEWRNLGFLQSWPLHIHRKVRSSVISLPRWEPICHMSSVMIRDWTRGVWVRVATEEYYLSQQRHHRYSGYVGFDDECRSQILRYSH